LALLLATVLKPIYSFLLSTENQDKRI